VRSLLDETIGWMQAGGKTTCKNGYETWIETDGETSSKTCGRKIKTSLDLRVISMVCCKS
jgi:hypothetical protein